MEYQYAIEYIHSTLKFGSKLGLTNITELLHRLGNPQNMFHVLHVAGTNGKGSVTAMMTHILHAADYRVGMFISPYLERFTERIQVDLMEIEKDQLGKLTGRVKEKVDTMVTDGFNHPTEFEIVTAIGFLYFAEQGVDFAVVEVGLGGRFDATNVVDPLISVITSISYDHMEYLGDTLSKIAFEKGGIIKEGRPVVSYPQEIEALSVLESLSAQRAAPFTLVSREQVIEKTSSLQALIFDFRYGDRFFPGLRMHLVGGHQMLNAATALTAIALLSTLGHPIKDEAIYRGMAAVRWPGRLEKLSDQPLVLIDGAHNVSGAAALREVILHSLKHKRIHLVLGMLGDKDVDGVIRLLCPLADRVMVTRPDNVRALDPQDLAQRIGQIISAERQITIEQDAAQAVKKAYQETKPNEALIVSGSLYLIGLARTILTTVINQKASS